MRELSEFVSFVSRKSGVKNVSLIESDIILHRMLKEIYFSELGKNYLFKGGSLFIVRLPKEFENFLKGFLTILRRIATLACERGL